MTDKIVVAYDGTPHAGDAVALARLLAEATDGQLALAHVHRADRAPSPSQAPPSGRQEFLRSEGERLLSQADELLGDTDAERHAVASTTTATGLRTLAESEGAAVIVFGSAHDGPMGRVHPGSAARRLLQNARCAVAFAPSGFSERADTRLTPIAAVHDDDEHSAVRTARTLAEAVGGAVSDEPAGTVGLLIIGARPSAERGRVMTDGTAERLIQSATAPVLVLPRGVALGVGARRSHAA
jgi:nucleotide-binding universal stress UspA family protein